MDKMLGFDPVNLPVPHEDGSFISERVSRIAELIREYDPNLDVRWIPHNKRTRSEPQFAIVERMTNGAEAVVFYVQDEKEFDGSVLERIYMNDAAKHGNILDKIEAQNQAVRALQEKDYKEKMAEATDLAYHILKSPKHTYTHKGIKYT